MRRLTIALLAAFVAIAYSGRVVRAQESLLPSASWGAVPVFSYWSFGTPLVQSTGTLKSVSQFAVPLRVRAAFGGQYNLDVTGGIASSSASVSEGSTTRSLSLTGPTDVKVRVTDAVHSDRVLLTAGLNLPTGKTGLSADETTVLQAIGAPSLAMPVSALGLGAGGTLGGAIAQDAGDWALAIGGSLEQRTEYTAIELALASGKALTKIAPGTMEHFTLGADRAVGEHRLSLLLVTDFYSQDKVTIGQASGSSETHYQLGPQFTGLAHMDIARVGWREAAVNLSVRHRSAFSDATGAKVDGSSGNYLDASFSGVRGGATGRATIFGVDARYHSGLSFSDALVAAAVSAVGVTGGVEIPMTTTLLRLGVHAQYGHFDTGTTTSNGTGLTVFGALSARREAR